jgi:hypothetical protein
MFEITYYVSTSHNQICVVECGVYSSLTERVGKKSVFLPLFQRPSPLLLRPLFTLCLDTIEMADDNELQPTFSRLDSGILFSSVMFFSLLFFF